MVLVLGLESSEVVIYSVREMVISISWVHTLEIIAMNYFQGKPAEASAWVQEVSPHP